MVRLTDNKRSKKKKKKDSLSLRQISSEMDTKAPIEAKIEAAKEDLYETAVIYMEDVLSSFKEKGSFSLDEGFRIIERIVDAKDIQSSLYIKALHVEDSLKFLANHSINVAVYSIKMALGLKYNRNQQLEIGVAGLFHDVGMCKIPEEIIYKKAKLNDREVRILQEHPRHGYELLKRQLGRYAYLAECVLQSHERIDGSGYPSGLKGDEIHEYAKVIGLVDVYESLTHYRPQRGRLLHFAAIKEIIHSGKRSFQKNHLKTLLNIFSIFPLYSYVRLNSNAIGRVIETHPAHPMRPTIQIIYDSHGEPVFAERIVKLPENPLLYIVESVSEEDFGKP